MPLQLVLLLPKCQQKLMKVCTNENSTDKGGIDNTFCEIARQLLLSRKPVIPDPDVVKPISGGGQGGQGGGTGEDGEEISDSCCS